MSRLRIGVLCMVCMTCGSLRIAYGQKDSIRAFSIESRFQVGKVLVKLPELKELAKNNPWSFQLDLSKVNFSQVAWNACGCYMKTGVTLGYTNFGNPKYMGHSFSGVLFQEPYLVRSNRLQLSLRAGVGLTYITKTYDSLTNPYNLFFGRHLNFLMVLNPNLYYRLSPSLNVNLSAQLFHFSNGGTAYPNWGMNLPMASVGLEYKINADRIPDRKTTPFRDRKVKLVTHVFGGTHIADAVLTYPKVGKLVTGINIGVIKPLTRVNALGVGGEIVYDAVAKVQEERLGKDFKTTIAALNIQHYFFLGRIAFGQQFATYITPLNPDVKLKLHQRYFMEYNIKGPWYAGITLKTHGNVSDYVAFSVGTFF